MKLGIITINQQQAYGDSHVNLYSQLRRTLAQTLPLLYGSIAWGSENIKTQIKTGLSSNRKEAERTSMVLLFLSKIFWICRSSVRHSTVYYMPHLRMFEGSCHEIHDNVQKLHSDGIKGKSITIPTLQGECSHTGSRCSSEENTK